MILGDAAPEADEGKRQVGSVRCMEIDLKTTDGCSGGAVPSEHPEPVELVIVICVILLVQIYNRPSFDTKLGWLFCMLVLIKRQNVGLYRQKPLLMGEK